MYNVLLVDDDLHILNANEKYLTRQGYRISRAEDGESALKLASTAAFDAVVLDVDMPGMDGVSVCSRLREVSAVPIIFLSAYARTDDRIRGLMAGGDDYIGKPYSLVELELRLRLRIQRHKNVENGEVLRFDALEIDLGLREARFRGERAQLTVLEFDLLAFLARNPDQVFSYEQLYDRVWKAPMNQGLHSIQVCMARVRQKLDALCPGVHWIETVRRKGYRFNSGARA
ncbi:MAG TPA: response regulator transcription factor [Candidatus Scatomorpha merdavium]|nr:response regulator transcription factor [Oscillospiraceae bacterium]HIS14950.1 response regulator transcription factor [Candidatus Scatomorpha merdavium]